MSLMEQLLSQHQDPASRIASIMPLLQQPQVNSLMDVPGMPGGGAPRQLALNIGSWIDSLPGFTIGGLEGYGGTGQISSGHIDNSQHYSGMAGDVGYSGGGRFPDEMAALDWLYRKLGRRYGDRLTELIWRQPDHWDHLHYGTRPGG